MQAQHAVSMAAGPDGDPIQLAGEVAATQTATALDEDDTGGVAAPSPRMQRMDFDPLRRWSPPAQKSAVWPPLSPYTANGSRVSGADASLGDIWLQLFLQWPRWGLDSIHHQLHQVLDMDRDPSPSSTRPTIRRVGQQGQPGQQKGENEVESRGLGNAFRNANF